MKKTYALFAALCILSLSACFSPWTSGEGTITISFGTADQAGRIAVDDEEIAAITHYVILTGPAGVLVEHHFAGRGPATIAVTPGVWGLSVRAMGPRPDAYGDTFPEQILRALGFDEVEVRLGANTRAEVRMISAVEVANHEQLSIAIGLARTDGEKIILITDDIKVSGTYLIGAAGKNITLASDTDLTIARAAGNTGVMFDVSADSTLTLGRPGMGGSITIDGGGPDISADGPIIRLSGGANLLMNQGLSLTGNQRGREPGSNGGAVEVGGGGTFAMNGGEISNNSAGRGGGVHVANKGIFTMSGGVIHGADRPGTQNSATFGGAALFVAIGGTARYGGAFAARYGSGNIPTTSNTLPHVITDDTRTFTIEFAHFHEVGPILGSTIVVGETAVFSLEDPGQYDSGSIAWFMDGSRITGAAVSGINGGTLTVDPSLHGNQVMTHFVTVELSKGGRWYSQLVALEVLPGDEVPPPPPPDPDPDPDLEIVFDLAGWLADQELGSIDEGAGGFAGTPFSGAGASFAVVQHEGRMALEFSTGIILWSGLRIENSFVDFQAGDTIRIAGLAMNTVQPHFSMNVGIGVWAPLGGWSPVFAAGNVFDETLTVGPADVIAISENTMFGNPPHLQLRTNRIASVMIITELIISRDSLIDWPPPPPEPDGTEGLVSARRGEGYEVTGFTGRASDVAAIVTQAGGTGISDARNGFHVMVYDINKEDRE